MSAVSGYAGPCANRETNGTHEFRTLGGIHYPYLTLARAFNRILRSRTPGIVQPVLIHIEIGYSVAVGDARRILQGAAPQGASCNHRGFPRAEPHFDHAQAHSRRRRDQFL